MRKALKSSIFAQLAKKDFLIVVLGILAFFTVELVLVHYFANRAGDLGDHYLLKILFFNFLAFAIVCALIYFVVNYLKKAFPEKFTPEEAEYYLAAMEAAKDGVCITDPNGVITYVNEAFCRYHGYKSSYELIGKSWNILYDAPHKDWIEEYIIPLLRKQWKWTGRTKGIRKDGTLFDQELSLIQFIDGGFIDIMRDITGQIEAESLSKARLAAIEAAGDGIGIVNNRGILIYLNKALMDIHGIDEKEKHRFVGRHWENLYTKQGRTYIKNHVLPVFERHGSWHGESALPKLNGEMIYAELSLTKLPGGGMIGTARDVTLRKQNEEEKAQLKDQFYQAQKMEAIGRMAGGIAHDFNNILAAMMGYSEFLIDDLDKKSKEHEYASQIYKAGLQARDLVDHMLAFSRRSETSRETIDLTEPFDETIKILSASFPRSVEFSSHISAKHPFIKGNATQIGQVLMNLCVNAKDAMDDERGSLRLTLEDWNPNSSEIQPLLSDEPTNPSAVAPTKTHAISRERTHLYVGRLARNMDYLKLTVSDTGSGIPKTVAEHIFEPFYTTKSVNEGTGLGMSMAHGVVLEHGGAIFMDSETGKGTTFELFFPVTTEIAEHDEEREAETISGEGRVLIVEDQDSVRMMMKKMTERLGYQVKTVSDPVEALEMLSEENDFDVIITDHTMPKMTGIELAQKIYQDKPELPFIMISGYSQKRLENAANLSPNIKGVLRKPIKSNRLSNVISDVIRTAGHPAESEN